MIDRLIEALQEAGLLLQDQEIKALSEAQSLLRDEDIADALWLVAQMGSQPAAEALAVIDEEISGKGSRLTVEEIEEGDIEEDAPPPSPVVPAYVQDSREDLGELETPEGLPLQVQAASALPNARGMGHSLRPLMHKVSSRTQQVLDEIATVDRIAQEDIWVPVLKPKPERWFDLELVIESSPLSFVWESTLAEFQRLLELQGAFRNVRAWALEGADIGEPKLRPRTQNRNLLQPQAALTDVGGNRRPRELIDAAGRALLLYISDCRSHLWQQGKIHDWLQLWGQHQPTTVVQLLPERLWSQTALNVGFKVQVSAFTPGVANPKLQVYDAPSRRKFAESQTLTLPVMTLTAEALKQWARVVTAGGQQRLPARLFDITWVKDEDRIATADWAAIEPQTPEARVELFNATVSAPAIRLARLMSVVPVELPVVHLIQQVFFKQAADPIHIAEVYDSCLLKSRKSQETGTLRYEFVPGVRELLNQVNTIDETLDVLDAISQEIALTLGFEIKSFTALLAPDIAWDEEKKAAILPFAQIATQVLHRLGGQYEALARQVEQDARQYEDWIQPEDSEPEQPEPIFPELRRLEFIKAELIDADDQTEHRRVNDAGLDIIKSFENLSIEAYQDAVGGWTIGYGHTSEMGTPEVEPGMQITEAEAEIILKQDLQPFEMAVEAAVTIETNDDQFSAMVSFVYNVGSEAYHESDLLQKHNAGDFLGAAEEFMRWVYAEGRALSGLQQRRDAERALYLSHESTDTAVPAFELINDEFNIATITIESEASEAKNTGLERFEFVVATISRRQAVANQSQAESNQVVEAGSEWVIQRQRRSAYRLIEQLTTETPMSSGEKQQLEQTLRNMRVDQFEDLVSVWPTLKLVIPPQSAPQANRAGALLQWAEGISGPSLAAVRNAVQRILDVVLENESLTSYLGLEMVSIPGNTFTMGSPDTEPERYDREGPQHEVTVQPFFMGRYPITQAQWRFVADLEQVNRNLNPEPSRFKGDNRPVERVSWYEAVEFCDRLANHTGREYRLPTEAEWEYACRAGTKTPFHFGATISSELANYRGTTTFADGPAGEYREETTPVDHFGVANAFGLSDMHGNVYEWCRDHYHDSYRGASKDGSAWSTNKENARRILRGGSWNNLPRLCRSASRFIDNPDNRLINIGFRVVCLAPKSPSGQKPRGRNLSGVF